MVKLEEVPDEDNDFTQPGPKIEDDDEWDTDDSSSIASDTSSLPDAETLSDRLYALKDMIPPTYRKHISTVSTQTYNAVSTTLKYGGKTLWVVSTSALLLGVPWALAFGEEQQVMEMEREMRMQQSANEVLVQQQGQGEAKAAL